MNEIHAGIESFSGTKSGYFNQVIGCLKPYDLHID